MVKAVFLDRDGTINVDKNYLYKIEDFEFLPGVIDGLRLLQEHGFLLIVVTNQSGIARGYFTENEYNTLNDWIINELEKNGVRITLTLYCPHHPSAKVLKYRKNCDCRKPKIGLYKKAIDLFDIDISSSYVIGDKIRDCSICEISDCKGYLISDNEDAQILDMVKCGKYRNVEYAIDLNDASKKIVENLT